MLFAGTWVAPPPYLPPFPLLPSLFSNTLPFSFVFSLSCSLSLCLPASPLAAAVLLAAAALVACGTIPVFICLPRPHTERATVARSSRVSSSEFQILTGVSNQLRKVGFRHEICLIRNGNSFQTRRVKAIYTELTADICAYISASMSVYISS